MFCVTNFGLVLRICIVNVMIFIRKIHKLVQDQFLQTVKDHQYDKVGSLLKVCLVFVFKFDYHFLSDQNLRLWVPAY